MSEIYFGVGEAVVDGTLAVALIAALVWAWGHLSNSAVGRLLQFILLTSVYAAWIAAPLLVGYLLFFVFPSRPFAIPPHFGGAVLAIFVAIFVGGFLAVQLGLALAYWNYFARFAHDKVGLEIPKVRGWHGYY